MKKPAPKKGEKFVSLYTGVEYEWNGVEWKPTGSKPYGDDPMKLGSKESDKKNQG